MSEVSILTVRIDSEALSWSGPILMFYLVRYLAPLSKQVPLLGFYLVLQIDKVNANVEPCSLQIKCMALIPPTGKA